MQSNNIVVVVVIDCEMQLSKDFLPRRGKLMRGSCFHRSESIKTSVNARLFFPPFLLSFAFVLPSLCLPFIHPADSLSLSRITHQPTSSKLSIMSRLSKASGWAAVELDGMPISVPFEMITIPPPKNHGVLLKSPPKKVTVFYLGKNREAVFLHASREYHLP